jgi:hypothetical protein
MKLHRKSRMAAIFTICFVLTGCGDATPSNEIVANCIREFAAEQQPGGYTCGDLFEINGIEIVNSKAKDKDYVFEIVRRMTLKKNVGGMTLGAMKCEINGGRKGEAQAIRSNFLVETWSNGYKCSLIN